MTSSNCVTPNLNIYKSVVTGGNMIKHLVVSLMLFLAACAPLPSAITTLAVYATPGKPLERFDATLPAEMIAASQTGTGYVMTVTVNVPRDKVTALTVITASLTQTEWEALLVVVNDQSLLVFTPAPQPATAVIDFGVRGYAITTGQTSVARSWEGPLENTAPPAALFGALVTLAHQKNAGPLFYLGGP
jgi:hypothetical protein